MPYIKPERRTELDELIEGIQEELGVVDWEGDLNYVITRLIGGLWTKEKRYFTIARICGVLVNVKDEFYRRVAVPYEDKAVQKNGDVPEYWSRE